MRVTIKGDWVKSDNFKQIVDSLNEEFAPLGIRIKNATCYQNQRGASKNPYFMRVRA